MNKQHLTFFLTYLWRAAIFSSYSGKGKCSFSLDINIRVLKWRPALISLADPLLLLPAL